jgi:hypothetical protein
MLRSVVWLLVTDVEGQPIGPVFKGQAVHDSLTREEMGLVSCPETSATVRNIPEERNYYYLHLGGSEKSRTAQA